jgi:hypothetical protein
MAKSRGSDWGNDAERFQSLSPTVPRVRGPGRPGPRAVSRAGFRDWLAASCPVAHSVLHPDLLLRRAQSPRHVRPEAGRSGGSPRGVLDHRDVRSRNPRLRAFTANRAHHRSSCLRSQPASPNAEPQLGRGRVADGKNACRGRPGVADRRPARSADPRVGGKLCARPARLRPALCRITIHALQRSPVAGSDPRPAGRRVRSLPGRGRSEQYGVPRDVAQRVVGPG